MSHWKNHLVHILLIVGTVSAGIPTFSNDQVGDRPSPGNYYGRPRGCTTFSACGSACCRDDNNKIVGLPATFPFLSELQPSSPARGTCRFFNPRYRYAQPGERCVPGAESGCLCKPGYKCHTPMQGVCCPVSTCREQKWVEEQEEFWRNCGTPLNPNCRLPP